MRNTIKQKCRKIRIILTDVDGVLTDGGMYYSKDGDILKKFHVRDGMGVTLLRKNGIFTIIITKEKTMMVKKWAQKMTVKKLYDGIIRKESMIDSICTTFNVKLNELAYIGDDVNDLEIMRQVGFSATPKDGIKEAKQIADYISKAKGGEGVFREVAEFILKQKFNTNYNSY